MSTKGCRRRVPDEAEARTCLYAVGASGLPAAVAPRQREERNHERSSRRYTPPPYRRIHSANGILPGDVYARKRGRCRPSSPRSVRAPPLYSPELNPIELAWSKVKDLLRAAKARTIAELNAAINTAMRAVSTADASGWFAHCGYFAHAT